MVDRLSTPGMCELVDPRVMSVVEWDDIVSSAILRGRSMQNKLLQAAKNSGYPRYRRKWRAAFWTQKRKAYRSVMSEGGSPSMLTLKHPVTRKHEHSKGLKKLVEEDFGERPPYKIAVPDTLSEGPPPWPVTEPAAGLVETMMPRAT